MLFSILLLTTGIRSPNHLEQSYPIVSYTQGHATQCTENIVFDKKQILILILKYRAQYMLISKSIRLNLICLASTYDSLFFPSKLSNQGWIQELPVGFFTHFVGEVLEFLI